MTFDLQSLLEVVNDLFEEQTDLEKIVRKIMYRAQTLLKCERCSVQLLEDIESPVGSSLSLPLRLYLSSLTRVRFLYRINIFLMYCALYLTNCL